MTHSNGILAMDPENYREIDGVVFDLESYARHCKAEKPETSTLVPEPPPVVSPSCANESPATPDISEPSREPQAEPSSEPQQQNGILALNPEQYREIDGVVFDLDSYARHCQPLETQPQEDEPASVGVFPVEPYHAGWYQAEDGRPPVPIMGGALPPAGVTLERIENGMAVFVQTVWIKAPGSGSGSGSYMTSYTTSYRTSWVVTSGSGSGSGYYVFGSSVFPAGGYGLELI